MLYPDRANARRAIRNAYFADGGKAEGLAAHLNSFDYIETAEGIEVRARETAPASAPERVKRTRKRKG